MQSCAGDIDEVLARGAAVVVDLGEVGDATAALLLMITRPIGGRRIPWPGPLGHRGANPVADLPSSLPGCGRLSR